MTDSIKLAAEELDLQVQLEQKIAEYDIQVIAIEEMYHDVTTLLAREHLDNAKIENGTMSQVDIMVSSEELVSVGEKYGFIDNHISLTVESGELSLEELTANRKSLIERFLKSFDNKFTSFTHIFKDIDNLIVAKDNENVIPTHNESVKELDKLTLPNVRAWLNKDTKAGIISNYIGNKFSIVSIMQDKSGADTRHDYYTVPASMYEGNKLKVMSQADLNKLVEFGITFKHKSNELYKEAGAQYLISSRKYLRSKIASVVYSLAFGIFALKRSFRQAFMADVFITGLAQASIGLKKSHLDSIDLIYNMVLEQTNIK